MGCLRYVDPVARSREEQAQDYGRRLGRQLEEYVLKLDQGAIIRKHGFPFDEGQVIAGAAGYLSYQARKRATPPAEEGQDDPRRN